MPGVITCPGLGDGDAVGICMPGVITCPGLGEGEGAGFLVLLGGVGLARGVVFFFLGAVFCFGFIFDMSCCSCCGNPATLTVNTIANTPNTRRPVFRLNQFMISPLRIRRSEHRLNRLKAGWADGRAD